MRTASEHLAEMRRHAAASLVGDAVREDQFELAFVEPDPMGARAPIIRDRMVSPRYGLRHFPSANRAPPALFLRMAVGCSTIEERCTLLRIAEEQLEFARIQPHSLAFGAAIDLDAVVLRDD